MSLLLLLQPFTPPAGSYAIINNANTTVNYIGDSSFSIAKTSGAGGFNADAVSSGGLTGDFVLRVHSTAIVAGMFLGMNSDPLTNSDYTGLDYCWANPTGGSGQIYESGSLISTPGGGTYHWIWRIGTNLYYGRGANLAAAQVTPDRTVGGVTATLYFDSSFGAVGDAGEVQLLESSVTGITGSTSMTFAPSASLTGKGAVSGSSSLTFAPAGTVTGKGALSGSSTLAFAPSGTVTGRAAITGTAPLTFAPSGTMTGKGAVSGSSTLVLSPAGTISGRGDLAGSSGLVFAPTGVLGGLGALSGTIPVSFSGSGSLSNVGGTITLIDGAAALTFSSSGNVFALNPITGSSSLRFVLTGRMTFVGPWSDVPQPTGAWAEQPSTGTWTLQPANDSTWTDDATATGTWTDAPTTGNWS